ncbi:hypothetical protein IVB30_41455 [Bradyrhizobium sp. 200]|uniref:hypothetical protein n=1 Tax=Bradyrhizobium sp. 200 TaxID=2782665 RepID=UPI001FFEA233|nr:hypothetical protein [Bradyrhizobium sp. 200]UPJ49334.1 hypothetical protein IVB30_41455 [Bradyrhizobium sp. 200]
MDVPIHQIGIRTDRDAEPAEPVAEGIRGLEMNSADVGVPFCSRLMVGSFLVHASRAEKRVAVTEPCFAASRFMPGVTTMRWA